jgi:hypothetical protein
VSSNVNRLSLVCAVVSIVALVINVLLLAPSSSLAGQLLPYGGHLPESTVAQLDGANAEVSSSFTFQGQLKSSGAPVTGSCDFTWDIYAASAGGASIASDADTLAVTSGLFTAVINVPAAVIDGNARFLEIGVRCPSGAGAYTALTPRQELQAAPYALGLRLPFSHTVTSNVSPVFAVTNTAGASTSPSLLGSSAGSDGVRGLSTGAGSADNGVYGETNSTASNEAGVKGTSTSSSAGGYFTSTSGYGVYGQTESVTDYGGYFSNPSATTSGAAIYSNGDAKQSLTGNGFVKAGVHIESCGTAPSIVSYFNNVNTSAITVSSGGSAGVCIVDFSFDVSNRYIAATSRSSTPRFITFLPAATTDQITFYKFDAAGTLLTGDVHVLVY